MASSKDPKDDPTGVPHIRNEPRPDFSKPPPAHKLPKALEDTLNNDEKFWEVMYEGKGPDSTDSNARYAAYAARARTILRSAHRYVAYTSDIGESFRPVAHPYLVRGAYAISWAYLIGDVSNEGYKAYCKNQRILQGSETRSDTVQGLGSDAKTVAANSSSEPGVAAASVTDAARDLINPTPAHISPLHDYRTVMAQRAVFQSIASMGLPAFTVHSVVKYSGSQFKKASNKTIRTWGPIGLGLAVVPFLPYIFDEPVEHAVEWTFHKGFEMVGGTGAVDDVKNKKEL